jgi:hypothetical protein
MCWLPGSSAHRSCNWRLAPWFPRGADIHGSAARTRLLSFPVILVPHVMLPLGLAWFLASLGVPSINSPLLESWPPRRHDRLYRNVREGNDFWCLPNRKASTKDDQHVQRNWSGLDCHILLHRRRRERPRARWPRVPRLFMSCRPTSIRCSWCRLTTTTTAARRVVAVRPREHGRVDVNSAGDYLRMLAQSCRRRMGYFGLLAGRGPNGYFPIYAVWPGERHWRVQPVDQH